MTPLPGAMQVERQGSAGSSTSVAHRPAVVASRERKKPWQILRSTRAFVGGVIRKGSQPAVQTLRGPRAWALMRTLAEVRPPYTAGALSARLDVDNGYVSRVLQARLPAGPDSSARGAAHRIADDQCSTASRPCRGSRSGSGGGDAVRVGRRDARRIPRRARLRWRPPAPS